MSDTTTSHLAERISKLESEVARISLFVTLFQESKKLKLDVTKFPVGEPETKYQGLFSNHKIDLSKYSLN
jgi:hypothetical protein